MGGGKMSEGGIFILWKKLLYKRRLTFKRSGGYEQPERKNVL